MVFGLQNNLSFLQALCRNEMFLEGHYNTQFINKAFPMGFSGIELLPEEADELVAAASTIRLYDMIVSSTTDSDTSMSMMDRICAFSSKDVVCFFIEIRDTTKLQSVDTLHRMFKVSVFGECLPTPLLKVSVSEIIEDEVVSESKLVEIQQLDWQFEQPLLRLLMSHGRQLVLQYEGRNSGLSQERYQLRLTNLCLLTILSKFVNIF